ncbi:hypothetical protein BI347_00905 [Chromobacterium sphagni]|uniref:Solute-binding protein family 3/N-terminal domain-containing protein n=1 Tax=Chromobacterium sphagni TaxID=1903179 RepID=A0A1S1WZ55_9NEIS|nr:transporter substrate-binding domain-containing protein [Chromobacterium sphagni]OHX12216.1 hypothetical protein BI347_00905 [Chromobacterium sphagni]
MTVRPLTSRRCRLWLKAMLICGCLGQPSPILAADGLTVALDASDPPFMYAGGGDSAQGLYPELIRQICDRAAIPLTVQAMSWRRALHEIDNSSSAVGGLYKTAEREKRYDFSLPLFTERIVVVYLRRRPLDFRSLADLDHKRIGVMAGWSYGDDFDHARAARRFTAYDGDSDQQNLQRLERGYLDAVLGIQEAMETLPAKRRAGLAIAATALAAKPTFIAVNKQSGQQALLQRFNQALEKMRQDGSYQQLVRKFFASRRSGN